MPFKTIVDPKTGQSHDEFIEPAAGAAPAAKPAATVPAKPKDGGFDLGAIANQATEKVVDTLGLAGGPAVSHGLKAAQAGISTMAKTGDVGQSLRAAAKGFNEPDLVQRASFNALRNIAQEPVNVYADLTGRPTTAANPDAPFPGLGKPLPKLAPKLGPLEEAATGLLQVGIEFIPVAKAVSWGGKALKAIPGVARGVQAVEATREAGLVGLAATGQVGKVASKALRVGTRAFGPTNVATGAIVDFAGVNPHGGRIYDLVDNVQQQVTGTPMEIPVLNYFKSRPGDVGSKARLKNVLEGGLILGPAQDTLMSLFRAAKYINRARNAAPEGVEAAASQAKQATQEFEQKAAEFVNSGRPPEPAPTAAPAPAQAAPAAQPPVPVPAADAAAVAVAQERYSRAQAKLDTHGPAPTKPSSEKKTFGAGGIANADPAAVARWQLETKAYQTWNRKYAPLKKEEVAAANELAAAQQRLGTTEPQVATEQAGAPAAPVTTTSAAQPPAPIGPMSRTDWRQSKGFKAILADRDAETTLALAGATEDEINSLLGRQTTKLRKEDVYMGEAYDPILKRNVPAQIDFKPVPDVMPSPERLGEIVKNLRGKAAGASSTYDSGRYTKFADAIESAVSAPSVPSAGTSAPAAASTVQQGQAPLPATSIRNIENEFGVKPFLNARERIAKTGATAKEMFAMENGTLSPARLQEIADQLRAQPEANSEVAVNGFSLADRLDELAALHRLAAAEPTTTTTGALAAPPKAELPDTRGQGQFFHGAASEFKLQPGGEYGGDGMNIYGNGLYATEDLKTAGSYQKKNTKVAPVIDMYGASNELGLVGAGPAEINGLLGRGRSPVPSPERLQEISSNLRQKAGEYGGSSTADRMLRLADTLDNYKPVDVAGQRVVYEISEKKPTKFYDLDAPISGKVLQELEKIASKSDLVAESLDILDPSTYASGVAPSLSLAQIMDEIRRSSSSFNVPAYEVQSIFDDLIDKLKADGYGGFTHEGGRLAGGGKRLHQVRIYWDPAESVDIQKVDLTSKLAAPVAPAAQAAPEPTPAPTPAPEPQGPEPVRATMPDDPWVNKVVEQVQANRDALERNDITLDDILENNVQRIQSPSGRTQYVVDNPDMAMGYKAFSDLLSRVEATGIQTASFEQINADTEIWLNSVGHNGKDVLAGLERISGPLSNYRENLRAVRAGQLLVDHSNLQAGVAAAQWLNSALGGAVDRNQLGAQLFAAAAAQKQANVAFEKVTRPIGQLLWSLQNPRPEPGSLPFSMGEEGAAAAGATPGEVPLPSTKDIKTELEAALQDNQGAPVSQSLGGTLSPEAVDAINTGDFSNPNVQAEMDALAMALSSGSIDPGFARGFWTNLPANVALGARGLNTMHASFLVSSGETINTNLLNGLVRLIDLPLTTATGALVRGDLASAGTALQMFVGYARSTVGAAKLAAHSFRLGRGFYDISHQSVDMMERLASQEATNTLAGVPTEMERVWTINDTPLIDATDKSNGAQALRAVWRTMTGPLRVTTTADTFIKALAGDSFEFTQNLRPGLERAVELGMEPGSKEAWKWANQYAEQVVKAKKRDLIVEGKTLTDAIMTSPNALNAARYATFTDDVWAEMEWNMPNPATGKPIGRSFERGAQLAAAKNITDPAEVTKFVENYLKNGTPGEAVSEAMMGTVGRTFSLIPEGYTLLSQNARVGPLFQAFQAFIRTPFDMLKSLARKGPTAVLVDTWWRDLNSSNEAIRDKAVGDVALGTAALAAAGLAIATSNVQFNGAGPLNDEAKRKWMSGGRMPYSFQMRVGTDPGGMPRWGEANSLRVFEPYTSLIGAMADYIDISGNLSTEQLNTFGANMVGDLLSRVVVGQLSKQYFKGLYDIVDAIMSVGDVETGPNVSNPLNKYLSRFAAGYTIPSAFGSGRRTVDPIARSVQPGTLASEYLDEVKSKLPGWSKDIPPIVDWVTGQDVVLAGIYGQQHLPADQPWLGLLYQFVPWSPLKVASPPHRVLQEMGALHGKGANFNGPSANDFGVELRLDVKTFNAYKREVATVVRDEAGRTLVEALQQEIDGPQYQALPFAERGTVAPAERVAQLSLIINKFKAMGKQTFLNRPENATLLRQYNERKAKIAAVGQGGVEPAQAGGSWSPTPGNR